MSQFGYSRVALSIGTIEPREGFVTLPAVSVRLCNLIRAVILVDGDKSVQRTLRLLTTANREVRQGFAGQLRPISGVVFHLRQSFLLMALRRENQASCGMDKRKLRVQFLCPL